MDWRTGTCISFMKERWIFCLLDQRSNPKTVKPWEKTLHTYSWAWAWHDNLSSDDPHSSDIPYQHTLLLVPLNRAWHWVPPLIAMHSLRRATQPRPHNGKKWAQLAFDMRCRSLGKLGGQRGKTTTKGFWCKSSSKWYCELLLCYPIIGYVKE